VPARPDLVKAIATTAAPFIRWLRAAGVAVTKGETYPLFGYTIQPPALIPEGYAWKDRGGDRMMQRLEAEIIRLGSSLIRGRGVNALLVEEGTIVGVEGRVAGGGRFSIRAQAVVLAGGGFEANFDLLREQGIANPRGSSPGTPAPATAPA